MKLISWNLLRLTGASLSDVVRLIEREQPDILLMQEATKVMDGLTARVGGDYRRTLLPNRIHGLAVWTPKAFPNAPQVVPLPSGAMFDRIGQVIDLGPIAIANVHLSHGQLLNRRQLRCVAKELPHRAAVVGDYNLVGPALVARLPGRWSAGTHPCRGRHGAAAHRSLPGARCRLSWRQSAAAGGVGSPADHGDPGSCTPRPGAAASRRGGVARIGLKRRAAQPNTT